ncbi:MAG TPA: hypothetical protein VLT33_23275, partial [Labilithrix sp.]|nr:hypothetical protein [Labilithrix sp.]
SVRPSHAPLPSVTNQHGRVFAQAELVTVTFPRYPYEARVKAFGDWVVGSSWLHGVCPEYGCGAKSHQSRTLAEEAPPAISPATLETMLVRLVDAGALPAPSDDTLFLVYFPAQTVMSILHQGPTGCDSGSAFHGSVRIGARLVPYTGVADCTAHPSSKAMFPKLSAEEIVEVASSHEIIEALTDPFFPPTPSFLLDDLDSPWFELGGEVADWCAGFTAREGEHVVTRVWSNEQAKLGRHPCVPAPADAVYFNAAPPESKAVSVARGGSVDVPITGWATSPIAPWSLRVIQPPVGPNGLAATLTLGASTIGDGETVTLHVTVPKDAPPGASRFFMLASGRPEDEWFQTWPMIVSAKK